MRRRVVAHLRRAQARGSSRCTSAARARSASAPRPRCTASARRRGSVGEERARVRDAPRCSRSGGRSPPCFERGCAGRGVVETPPVTVWPGQPGRDRDRRGRPRQRPRTRRARRSPSARRPALTGGGPGSRSTCSPSSCAQHRGRPGGVVAVEPVVGLGVDVAGVAFVLEVVERAQQELALRLELLRVPRRSGSRFFSSPARRPLSSAPLAASRGCRDQRRSASPSPTAPRNSTSSGTTQTIEPETVAVGREQHVLRVVRDLGGPDLAVALPRRDAALDVGPDRDRGGRLTVRRPTPTRTSGSAAPTASRLPRAPTASCSVATARTTITEHDDDAASASTQPGRERLDAARVFTAQPFARDREHLVEVGDR